MPYYRFREVKTPLKLLGIALFRDQHGKLWRRFMNGKRKPVGRMINVSDRD